MKVVNTTFGELSIDQLGAVDVHDHVIIDGSSCAAIPEGFIHIDVETLAEELSSWKRAGGGVIIDCSPIGAGRNITLLEKTSRSADLPLIACSGFHKLSYYPDDHWLYEKSEEQITDILIGECEDGVLIDDLHPEISNRSCVKAGILKFGVDASGITPTLSKLICAVGNTMGNTGVNCMIHTEPGVLFDDVVHEITKNHVPRNRVIFCHMGKSFDPQLHLRLADEGFFLEFDEMVRPYPPLSELATGLLDLIDRGFGKSILFAGDLARRSYWKCYDGKPGLSYLLTGLRDEMTKLGFNEQLLDDIWINNPRAFFCNA